jgi:hypothetical protein
MLKQSFRQIFVIFHHVFLSREGGGGSLQELTAANTLNLYQVSGEAGKIFT